jgi:zinc protease
VRDAARSWLGTGWHQVDVMPTPRLTSSASGVDRSTGLPAIPDDLPKLSFPKIQKGTLANGIQVVLAERHSVPVVELSMQFDAGYAADAGGKLGVASFAMSMLDTGTRNRTALEISAEADQLGANIDANSNLDASSVHLSAIKNELQPSIDLWADVIRNPVFSQEEIDRLRGRWIAGIAQEKAQPVSLALRLLPPAIYGPNHAYGVPLTGSGTVDSIRSITRDDLLQFKEGWIRPDNATIFVVGDTTLGEITPMLERAFRGWTAPATPLPRKNVGSVPRPTSPRVILIDKPGSPQSFILAGEVAPGLGTDQDVAIDAMNEVLGGAFTSRVNMNLREDKGWAYGARTVLQSAKGPRPFLVYAPVQTDRTGDSLAELVKELTTLRTTRPIKPDEMQNAIAGLTRELPGRFETNAAVLSSLVTSARYGRPLDYAASLGERYEALKLADLQTAADEVDHPESLIWVVVGDLSKIRSQVEALNIGPVQIWDDDGKPVE